MFTVLVGKKRGTLRDLNSKNLVWLDIISPSEKEIEEASKLLKIPLNILKEELNGTERPKIKEIIGYTAITFRFPQKTQEGITTPSMAIFLSENRVITLSKHPVKCLNLLRDKESIMEDSTYLAYRIMDAIIDQYFSVMESFDDDIDHLEDRVLISTDKVIVRKLFEIKKSLIFSHKALSANREVVTFIEKEYAEHLNKRHNHYFRNLYEDIVQLLDMESTYREILTGILDLYLSSVSNNLNMIMKRLTVYASFILVPTLISGIYGMNFKWMPELYWKYGYFFALGLMVFSVLAMYASFRRKNWI